MKRWSLHKGIISFCIAEEPHSLSPQFGLKPWPCTCNLGNTYLVLKIRLRIHVLIKGKTALYPLSRVEGSPAMKQNHGLKVLAVGLNAKIGLQLHSMVPKVVNKQSEQGDVTALFRPPPTALSN